MGPILEALTSNSLLLLAMVFIYGEIDLRMPKSRLLSNIIIGILIGSIGVLIIRNPWDTGTGIIYDTRTILMTASGVFFGLIPTLIGVGIASSFRIFLGGIGVFAGVLSIIMSAAVGLLWRHYRSNKMIKRYAIEYYLIGWISSLFMLVSQLAIPWPQSWEFLKVISFPVLLIYPVVFMLISIAMRNKEYRAAQEDRVRESEALLRASIEGPDDIIIVCLDPNLNYLYYNIAHEKSILDQYNKTIYKGMNFLTVFDLQEDRDQAKKELEQALAGEKFQSVNFYGPPESRRYYETYFSPIEYHDGSIIGVTTVSLDVTEKIDSIHKLQDSERKMRLLLHNMQLGVAVFTITYDKNSNPTDFQMVEMNPKMEEVMQYKKSNVLGKSIASVHDDLEPTVLEHFSRVATTGKSTHFETYFKSINRIFSVNAFMTEKNHFAIVAEDVTEKKKSQDQVLYLSYHDFLTGLRNRRGYEEDIERLQNPKNYPFSFVIADINGLKVTNDAFGHHVGDIIIQKIAEVLLKHKRPQDSLSRIGGDEFVYLLPNTTNEEANKFITKIKSSVRNIIVESVDVTVSFGLSTATIPRIQIKDLMPDAEKDMYTNKLFEVASNRSKTISTILNTLYLKSPREERHTKRVSQLCELMGKALNFRSENVSLLKTMGNLHDIGKIAIDGAILDKPGKLTKEEYDEIKRHPEIGFRILSTAPEYADLATDILYHHECFDGTGYPKGLKGEEIPLNARIIAVCDAFDAMTSYRTYRKILTKEEAKQELLNYKGTQFDPKMVDLFIKQVLPQLPSPNQKKTT